MKKFMHCASALAIGVPMSLGVAHAADGMYAKADVNYAYGSGTMNFKTPAQGGFASLLGQGVRSVDSGFSGGGAGVGYSWPAGWRVELEASYHKTELEKGFDIASGETKATLLMANGYMDFNKDSMIQPYVGAGLGFGNFDVTAATAPTPSNQVANGDAMGFAYQAQVGIGVQMSETTIFNIGWRYIGTENLGINVRSVVPPANTEFETDYHESSVTVGLRMHF